MLGVYNHILDLTDFATYEAGDINSNVILMWNAVKDDWVPPTTCTEDKYNLLKKGEDSALRCYVGFQYSFGGRWFNGYAPKYGKNCDSSTASNKIVGIGKRMKNVNFTQGMYTQFSNLKNYVIYLDPPYQNTTQFYYEDSKLLKFNHEAFWNWCKSMAKDNLLFLSSYDAPEEWELIFESTHKLTGTFNGKSKVRCERLYIMGKTTKRINQEVL